MDGPYATGNFKVFLSAASYLGRGLISGKSYRVTKAFKDADGHDHPIGEQWVYLGSMFDRNYNDVSFCVRLGAAEEWRIPLIWKQEQQGDVVDHWDKYLAIA